MFGLLNVYKPKGLSSYDVIRRLRRRIAREVKVGHCGTLDPLAEGVLVLCLGAATRLAELVQALPKEYVCLARLGATSTTDDAEGAITETPGAAAPTSRAVESACGQFLGTLTQVPPAYSAVKVRGRRAYEVARGGATPDLSGRQVTIHALEVVRYRFPELSLRVRCGGGTYVRSLVRDIGQVLATGAYVLELVRTSVGGFRADQAVSVERIESENLETLLLSPVEAIPPEARIRVTDAQARELSRGRPVSAEIPPQQAAGALLGALDDSGRLVAVVRAESIGGPLRPVKVFPHEPKQ